MYAACLYMYILLGASSEMLVTPILFLILGFCINLSQQSGFTSPNYVVKYGTGQYESNVLWYVGETRDVVYDISDVAGLDTYTVALWQQSILGGGAILGPVVNSKSKNVWLPWAGQPG